MGMIIAEKAALSKEEDRGAKIKGVQRLPLANHI